MIALGFVWDDGEDGGMLLSKLLDELLIFIGTTAVFLVLREKAIGPFVGKKAQAVLSKDVSTKRAVIVRGIIGAISMEAEWRRWFKF